MARSIPDATPASLFSKMQVLGKAVYRGPHLYSQTPMIRIQLDLGILEEWPTDKIPGFSGKLLAILPSLQQHGCSYEEPGGLVRRMESGTWLGHVAEHVALELQCLAGIQVTRGKTRSVKGKPGVYNVMFEYDTTKLGLWAGRLALELVDSLLPSHLWGISGLERIVGESVREFTTVENAVEKLKAIAAEECLGPTTRAIAEAAKQRGIPVTRLDQQSLLQLGYGKYRRCVRGSVTDATSQIAVDAACDKALTKKLLEAAGIPVPRGRVVNDVASAVLAAKEIGFPVVTKPLDANQGKGVTTNIATEAEVEEAFACAATLGKDVIVEQYFKGRDYRVLVINNEVIAVSERVPAHIIGDGTLTVQELIGLLNNDPRRGTGHEKALTKIVIDKHLENGIARNGYLLTSIPAAGEKVWLSGTANLSKGATAIDRTNDIHPANTILMERAARAIGLDVAGIDVVAPDISLPLAEQGGGVLEVNASPGFRMHVHPSEGRPRPAGEAVVSMLFPKGARSSVPIAAITGTNGKSTVTRMVAHILRQGSARVGFTSTSGVYINDELLWAGDSSGPKSARRLLADPTIDFAVLETARGGLLREGLAFDSCDVGAVLNVADDHLGISGVETLEDLAALKSVVAETVSRHGVSVLNADDPLTRKIATHARGRVCFFSMQGGRQMSDFLRTHTDNNQMAVVRETWAEGEQVTLYDRGRRAPVIAVDKIPATMGGSVRFNIENALAATAIAYGLGIDIAAIRSGLAGFNSTFEQNPGRLNIYDGHGFRVVMDYAHNPAALTSLMGVIRHMRGNYARVIGTVSTPGDRRDEHIRNMGRIAAENLDFIVFREGPDTRGRPEGEVVSLLAEGALATGFPKENIICVIPEEDAADLCLQKAMPGDLVVLMPSDIQGCWKRVLSFRPQPPSLQIPKPGHVTVVNA